MNKILLYIIMLMMIATTAALWLTKDSDMAPMSSMAGIPVITEASPAAGATEIGGAFTLTDQHGNEVRDGDFRGRLMLVFFGFTHCPDICPITTKALSDTMGLLGDKADQVAPIFITVDPERDTSQVMNSFFANFDARMVALTGTAEQTKQAASAYKAYYAKTQPEDEQEEEGAHHDDYLMDHSGYIYFMDREGEYIRHFQYDAQPEELVAALTPYLK